ncbi:hypothetical protein [Planctomicrobium sp. SH664]|uniref:hypothetical protein n=1 Tax=Planctomicrobium sp. SH664 TaxID=3448125 RepID=UPI003F5B4C25
MNERKETSAQEKMRAAAEAERPTSPWLLVGGGLAAALLVIGCGFCAIGMWWFRPQITEDPEQASQMLQRMVEIHLPADFQPRGTVEWNMGYVLRLKGVYYESHDGKWLFTAVEVNSRLASDSAVRRHIRETLLQEGAGGTPLIVDNTRTRQESYRINGAPVDFNFETAEDPSTKRIYHLVQGVLNSKSGGQVLVSIRVDADSWQPEIVQKMLGSLSQEMK